MPRCHVCKVETTKNLKCSQCKKTNYCSAECQKKDWKVHKRSVCIKPAIIHKLEKMMKKSSGPGTPWGNLNRMEDIAWEDRRLNPQPASLCDGCFTRFIGFPKKAHDDFEEDDNRDPVAKYKHCNDCDWTICEACTRPENQGTPIIDRPPGTCRCPTSNFGVSYCLSGPSYLDGDNANRTPYRGDRHPPIAGSGYDENAYEAKERACRTCGVIARCLKKERLKDAAPGMQ